MMHLASMPAEHPSFTPKAVRELTRNISLVENALPGHEELLRSLPATDHSMVIGVTGPPGAGKSTLVDALIGSYAGQGLTVAVVCVDPSSPFTRGALLGDRIRMNRWHDHPGVFIRSLATRGSLGGLNPMIIEITALLQASGFDRVIVETVGVGQSEVEIAGLADVTVVVLVPEAGDEVQAMKAGIMEIADIFVVNKCDRPDADAFLGNLRSRLLPEGKQEIPVIKAVATTGAGIEALQESIEHHLSRERSMEKKVSLLTEKAWQLIRQKRMEGLDRNTIAEKIRGSLNKGGLQLFKFIEGF
jgi:LAO/AO transport system kinase